MVCINNIFLFILETMSTNVQRVTVLHVAQYVIGVIIAWTHIYNKLLFADVQ